MEAWYKLVMISGLSIRWQRKYCENQSTTKRGGDIINFKQNLKKKAGL
jgi:hypothetical protein